MAMDGDGWLDSGGSSEVEGKVAGGLRRASRYVNGVVKSFNLFGAPLFSASSLCALTSSNEWTDCSFYELGT